MVLEAQAIMAVASVVANMKIMSVIVSSFVVVGTGTVPYKIACGNGPVNP